jgi:hypothetical protein
MESCSRKADMAVFSEQIETGYNVVLKDHFLTIREFD